MRKNSLLRFFSLLLIVVMIHTSIPFITASARDSSGRRIMVSLGDSYSSGEGVENFYHQDWSDKEKSTDPDFLAHRSENSWPGQLKLKGICGTMKDYKDENWYFVASSGAETQHFNGHAKENDVKHKQRDGKQAKEYKRNKIDTTNKPIKLEKQLSVFDELKSKHLEADYVTMTIGGNDVGFATIIKNAATSTKKHRFINPCSLADQLTNAWEIYDNYAENNIRQAYKDVRNKAGEKAHILVAGYPTLIDENKENLRLSPFSEYEAKLINKNVIKFNDKIEKIVNEYNNFYFVSVKKAFENNMAYSKKPFINGIELNKEYDLVELSKTDPETYASAYSMHPNEEGTKAYAKCVQKVIDTIESPPDFKAIESYLTKNANNFVGGDMLFRGLGSKIYFCDDPYRPTGVFSFDTETGSCQKITNLSPPSNKKVNIVGLYESGFSVKQLNTDSIEYLDTQVYDYSGKKAASNANAFSVEYDGERLYYYNSDSSIIEASSADGTVYNGDIIFDLSDTQFSDCWMGGVFTYKSQLFIEIYYQEHWILVTEINGEYREIADFGGGGGKYIDGDTLYYVRNNQLYRLSLKHGEHRSKIVCDIETNANIYFVCGNRIYYGINKNGGFNEIYRMDIGSKAKKLHESDCPMGGI